MIMHHVLSSVGALGSIGSVTFPVGYGSATQILETETLSHPGDQLRWQQPAPASYDAEAAKAAETTAHG